MPLSFALISKTSHWIANSTHLIETSASIQCLICGQSTLYNMHTTAKPVIKVITLPVLLCFPHVRPNYADSYTEAFLTSVALMDVCRTVFFETYSTYEAKNGLFYAEALSIIRLFQFININFIWVYIIIKLPEKKTGLNSENSFMYFKEALIHGDNLFSSGVFSS